MKKKSFIQRLKEWKTEREPVRARKPKLAEEELAIIRRKAGLPPNTEITVSVNAKQTKAKNFKMYHDDIVKLEQIASVIADNNESLAIRKAIGVIYEDILEKGLIKT